MFEISGCGRQAGDYHGTMVLVHKTPTEDPSQHRRSIHVLVHAHLAFDLGWAAAAEQCVMIAETVL